MTVNKHVIGKCPHCGGRVVEFSRFYGCDRWRPVNGGCPFTMPKHFTGKDLPLYAVKQLLSEKQSGWLEGFVSKSGSEFGAYLELAYNGRKYRLKMRFEG